MEWIIAAFLSLALAFSVLGWRWERRMRRPPLTRTPLVSILIPSYNNPHLPDAVASAKALDYPKKEILVVSEGTRPKVTGVQLLHSPVRQGKSRSLNQAVQKAKGEILFFMDADTVADTDTLTKLVPWFRKGVAAVSPKFTVRNRTTLLTKLIGLEHQFISSLFKIHMSFGSLISFRGCGIAISRDAFLRHGGWRETVIEDTDLAARMVAAGDKILYDPHAVVRTVEPDTWAAYRQQRTRWGRGTAFSFLTHYRFYLKNPQFSLYIFPYLLLFLAIGGFLLYQTSLALPAVSLYLIYTLSIREAVGLLALLAIPLVATYTGVGASVTAASITHFAIVTKSERTSLKDLALTIPYVAVFFPMTISVYARGALSAIADKRNRRPELDLRRW
ncbi:MAG: glycosyltransferase family 2 protein [Candidatus Aenigmarchaeota archaeon]|nr:glycosyltransferase family 2 protein [Candidatus Aenigmarchaeota archaeon]